MFLGATEKLRRRLCKQENGYAPMSLTQIQIDPDSLSGFYNEY